ncbi:phage tail protein [Tolumonas lignilytica]|uniref:phage tail protein n=1 Tax=Tolumonas lignilytica TaxID=1283284 RepID=UPI0004639B40|nr:tail fiber protein [Tolumonas lignilytica]
MLKKYVPSPLTLLASFFGAISVLVPSTVYACGEDAYIGQICVVAGTYCPRNTAEAAGQILAVSSNQALFSLLSNTYGGDGRTTFALPDLRGRGPVGWGTGPGLSAHQVGQKFGNETIIQTVSQMPVHNHAAMFTPGSGSAVTISALSTQGAGTLSVPQDGSMLAASLATGSSSANIYAPSGTTGATVKLGGVSGGGSTSGGTVTVNPTGNGQPMNIVPPEIAMHYCIVTNGVYPPRP